MFLHAMHVKLIPNMFPVSCSSHHAAFVLPRVQNRSSVKAGRGPDVCANHTRQLQPLNQNPAYLKLLIPVFCLLHHQEHMHRCSKLLLLHCSTGLNPPLPHSSQLLAFIKDVPSLVLLPGASNVCHVLSVPLPWLHYFPLLHGMLLLCDTF